MSTYFRVKAVPAPTFGREATPAPPPPDALSSQETMPDSQTTLVATSSLASVTASSSASTQTAMDVEMVAGDAPASAAPSSSAEPQRHFAASFRGRAMHGTLVDLPAGYSGVVLRAPEDKTNASAAASGSTPARRPKVTEEKPKGKKGRAARRAKRAQVEAEAEAIDVDAMEGAGAAGGAGAEAEGGADEGPARVLCPTGTFGSFVLWHPDIPVDEGRDEYLRSLTEWTRLAAEVRHIGLVC